MIGERMGIIEPILNTFENNDIKEFAITLLNDLPEYIWEVGASSTGKYHPAYSLGDGGLMRHSMAVVRFLNFFLELEQYSSKFTSRERDLMRVAAFTHDGRKSGTQEDYMRSKYTKFDHPLLMANEVRKYDGEYLNHDEIELIASIIESHMGQWNTDKKSSMILPKLSNIYQELMHLADYLASRKSLTIEFEHVEAPKPIEIDPFEYKLTFGKHSGQKLIDVYRNHKDYVDWMKENITRPEVLEAIKAVEKKINEEEDEL